MYIGEELAYFDLSNGNYEKHKSLKAKVWGISLIILCSLTFLILLTNFFPFCKSVLLGLFGLFIYPLSIVTFCIAMALLNHKKYIMPKKYIIFISGAVLAVLALLNIIILGNPSGAFFEYLGLTYAFKYTGGGLFVGLFLAPFIKLLGVPGAVIVFIILFIIFTALIVDFIHSIKTYGYKKATEKKPIKLEVEGKPKQKLQPLMSAITEKSDNEKFNVFLDKKFEEEKENRTALIKLGLVEGNLDSDKAPNEKKKSLREQLLTPPEIDTSFFTRNYGNKNTSETRKNEINSNFNTLKNNEKFSANDKKDQTFKFGETSKKETTAEDFTPKQNFFATPEPTFLNEPNFESAEIKPKKFADLNSENEYHTERNYNEEEIDDDYNRPPLALLDDKELDLNTLNEDIVGKRIQLENTLETFGINAKVIGVVVGPSVTRYEIEMPHGVSVKKIIALEDDISLAMAARSGIRIEAPIPGKSAVGIEVPNDNIATVSMREVIETEEFKNATSPVTFALGKNISGAVELCNLAKMPHILVAGATNSGKSICLNVIILSMIYRSSPNDVRLILIDPKRVEFSLYNDLPHLLIPNVITEVDKAVNALLWCVNEMERRFELLQMARCRNLEEYNKTDEVLSGEAPKMPYIVVVVDELADLMSSGKKELDEYLRRLTQKSRASGILLVLATQRPSVDVITGVIKTNCPARISFALTSNTDSRTILDCGGAENLLGRGDMLYKPTDAGSPRRVQGCFVSGEEVERIVDFVKQNNSASFDEKTNSIIEKESIRNTDGQIEGSFGDPNWDPLLPQALKMFIENGQASTSAIQRRFLAGFPRASRIVDQLCQMGYLSAPEGNKPRKILITMEEFFDKFGQID